jgi:hypothetical protein
LAGRPHRRKLLQAASLAAAILSLSVIACATGASAAEQAEPVEKDHLFVLEIGGAGERDLGGGRANFGGTIAGEVTPIENWLELEMGVTALGTAGHTELSGDFIFKKPFRLSPSVELMVGAGPSVARTLNGAERGTTVAAEVALDVMVWTGDRIGWYVEPSWSVVPRNGQQSVGVNAGFLIAFP